MAMIEVKLQYRHFLLTRTIVRRIPTSYKEMSLSQFLAILKLSKGWISDEQFYCSYFGVSMRILNKLDIFQLYMLTQNIRLLDQDKGINFFIVKRLGSLRSPEDKLRGMSFQQFMTVDQYFSWYIYTEKRQYMNLMLAALYMEEGGNFFDDRFEKRLEYLHGCKEEMLYPAVVNWMLIKNWLTDAYGSLFPETASSQSTRKKKGKPRPGSWLAIFDALVGDNLAFIEEYKRIDAMDALRIINRKIKEQKHHHV